jgi:hypothetical protein
MHVVDRLAVDQPGHPVHQSLAVRLLGVEQPVSENHVLVAGRDVAQQIDTAQAGAGRGRRNTAVALLPQRAPLASSSDTPARGYAAAVADDARVPAVRASDDEREVAMGRLRDAAAEGRLTFEELADRVESAADAVTREELDRLVEDLPVEPVATPPAEAAPAPTLAFTVFGDVRRAGAWSLPAEGKWRSVFGDVVLDVREARVTNPEVRVEAGSIFGDVELLLPEGVEVEVRSRTPFGDIKHEAGEPVAPGAPRIVLSGGTVFGDVRVRTRRLRGRLADRLADRGRGRLEPPA